MLDLSIPETAKAVSPIVRTIEMQYCFLQKLLHENLGLIQEMKEKLKQRKINMDSLCNDMREEIIVQEYNESEFIFNLENNFCHSFFIMSFSYFESIIAAICKNHSLSISNQVEKNVQKIKEHTGLLLADDIQSKCEYVLGDLKLVRNLLVHNYNGTARDDQLAAAKKETDKGLGFHMYENSFAINMEFKYIKFILDNIYAILNVLGTTC